MYKLTYKTTTCIQRAEKPIKAPPTNNIGNNYMNYKPVLHCAVCHIMGSDTS